MRTVRGTQEMVVGYCNVQVTGVGALSRWWQWDRWAIELAYRSTCTCYQIPHCGGTSVKLGCRREVVKVIRGETAEGNYSRKGEKGMVVMGLEG